MVFFTEDIQIMTIRLIIAAILGGLIGIEREFKSHPAGFRTHLLVSLGSCLMMLLSIFGFNEFVDSYANIRFDPSRLPSYVVSGIGFLGAGTILVHGVTVRGLTTAATIWVVAGIGLVVGIGMYFEAIFTTIIVILSLIFLNKIEKIYMRKQRHQQLSIIIRRDEGSLSSIVKLLEKNKVLVHNLSVEEYEEEQNGNCIKYTFSIKVLDMKHFPILFDELQKLESVHKIYTITD